MRNKVVIYVEGGNVQAVRASKPEDLDVLIFDVDNLKEDKKNDIVKLWQNIEKNTEEVEYI